MNTKCEIKKRNSQIQNFLLLLSLYERHFSTFDLQNMNRKE